MCSCDSSLIRIGKGFGGLDGRRGHVTATRIRDVFGRSVRGAFGGFHIADWREGKGDHLLATYRLAVSHRGGRFRAIPWAHRFDGAMVYDDGVIGDVGG